MDKESADCQASWINLVGAVLVLVTAVVALATAVVSYRMSTQNRREIADQAKSLKELSPCQDASIWIARPENGDQLGPKFPASGTAAGSALCRWVWIVVEYATPIGHGYRIADAVQTRLDGSWKSQCQS